MTWDDGDEVSISCGPTQRNVFYRYNASDNSFTSINAFDEIWLLGNEEYDVTAYYPCMGEEGTTPPVQNVEITSDNQANAEERVKYDYLYAATKATKAEPNVHLNFNHVMSRVNLKFVPGTDPDGNPVTLTSIECYLVGMKLKGTFDTTTGVAAVTEDAALGDLRQMLTADNDYTFTAYLLPIALEKTVEDTKKRILEVDMADTKFGADEDRMIYFFLLSSLRREHFATVGIECGDAYHYLTDEEKMRIIDNLTAKEKALIRRDYLLANFKGAFGSNAIASLLLDFAQKHMPETLADIKSGHNEVYEKRHKRIEEKKAVLLAQEKAAQEPARPEEPQAETDGQTDAQPAEVAA